MARGRAGEERGSLPRLVLLLQGSPSTSACVSLALLAASVLLGDFTLARVSLSYAFGCLHVVKSVLFLPP